MQNFKRELLSGLSILLLIFPNLVFAESVVLKTAKTIYRAGDSFEVSVYIDAGSNSINTISGKIKIPKDFFQISNLRYGNSIVTLWVEKPTVDQSGGQISFSGGIPGGFNSKTGQLLTFALKATKTGTAVMTSEDMTVLLNDGQGTPLSVATPALKLTILDALPAPKVEAPKVEAPKVEVYVPPVDNTPPEGFIPLVSRHPSIADNDYFVSFSAVDKGSGIGYYEIKEIPRYLPFKETDWVRTDGLYVLKYQLWTTKIIVRAYDQGGNYIDGEAFKPMDPVLTAALAVMAVLLLLYIRKLSTSKNSRLKGKMLK